MPAGTKLIAGNKPVSFLTAQQLQQLQQQGQATQVSGRGAWLAVPLVTTSADFRSAGGFRFGNAYKSSGVGGRESRAAGHP